MALHIRPKHCLFIVAQSVPLEKQQQLMGLFWTLALAVILLFLFVGVMMVLFRVIRRRMRLNEQAQSNKNSSALDLPNPWNESARRLQPSKENWAHWESDRQAKGEKPVDNEDDPEDGEN